MDLLYDRLRDECLDVEPTTKTSESEIEARSLCSLNYHVSFTYIHALFFTYKVLAACVGIKALTLNYGRLRSHDKLLTFPPLDLITWSVPCLSCYTADTLDKNVDTIRTRNWLGSHCITPHIYSDVATEGWVVRPPRAAECKGRKMGCKINILNIQIRFSGLSKFYIIGWNKRKFN